MSESDAQLVLVTGAGGFIGSAAVRALASTGIEVRAHVGAPGQSSADLPPGIETVVADLTDVSVVRPLLDGVDTVLHLAGPPSVAESFIDPIGYLRVHVVGTTVVLDACRGSDVSRFVYVSSAEVYGAPRHTPVNEDSSCEPASPYGAAKLAAEGLVRAIAPSFGVQTAILRPFSIYGPGQRPTSLVGTIVAQAKAGGPVRIVDARPVRDMIFVDDVAQALLAACRAPLSEDPVTLNVCSGQGTASGELARMVAQLAGVERVEVGAPPDRPPELDVFELVGDPDRADRELHWRARTPLEVGLTQTLEASS